jgi:uncharacterized protein (TIGR02996 family)
MNHDDAFLQEIIADPDNDGPRLVYADYLEEHGDSDRAEFIRVCEAMRRVPVFADDYWRLKARRNELRPSYPTDWLTATRYDGSRYDPLFREGIPADWKGRWRLIREFTERWHGLPLGDVGGRRDAIRIEERRFGRQLPPSLQEYVAYAHDVAPAQGVGVVHRDHYTMRPLDEHPALSVMQIAEGNVHWAILEEDLRQPDPPVYAYYRAVEDETRFVRADTAGPESPTLTDFVLGFVHDYKPDGGLFRTPVREAQGLRDRLQAAFPVHLESPRGTTYEGNGVLASLGPDLWGPGHVLCVCVHPSTVWERVPTFLWEYVWESSNRRGMFLTAEDRQRIWGHWGDAAPPELHDPVPPPLRNPPAARVQGGQPDGEVPF